jgi:chemotaxis family two-component system sensor histidine kinase/response regulator PixL
MRDGLTAARMNSLGEVLNRFPRLLQQLSAAHGKPAELLLSGTEVLVDKAIAEKLYDPLLHLVRNAFDHGIESPTIRRARGKPETGRIEIHAYHQGNRTVIAVKDDGEGINLQRIVQRAIELNLLAPEQVRHVSEPQLFDLLFEPGFSTVSELSELSGRGLGLNVVRTQLQALKGNVKVTSTAQRGTTFLLYLPVSLSVTKLLVCQAGGMPYTLSANSVEQVVLPQPDQLTASASQRPALRWRYGEEDCLVPVYYLAELLTYANARFQVSDPGNELSLPSKQSIGSMSIAAPPSEGQISPILLLHTASGLAGLAVERVLGEQELVIRPLGDAIAPPPYIYGCCILGNSRLALVIDADTLMQRTLPVALEPNRYPPIHSTPPLPSSSSSATMSLPPSLDHPTKPITKTILIVDDSLTLRQTLTQTLQNAGYQVLQATDGLEAIAHLQQHPHIALVICDIEMPRLNGFAFLSKSRKDPNLANIPVIMLTSRTHNKHRHFALELGAAAYVTKPYVESELLTILDSLITKS